jgi:hypothetical protein
MVSPLANIAEQLMSKKYDKINLAKRFMTFPVFEWFWDNKISVLCSLYFFLIQIFRSLSNLANYLCNDASFELPTCGMILLKFPFDAWEMISRDTAELIFYDYPKNNFQ